MAFKTPATPEKILKETTDYIKTFQEDVQKSPKSVEKAFKELSKQLIAENRALTDLKARKDTGTFSINLETANSVIDSIKFLENDRMIREQIMLLGEGGAQLREALANIKKFAQGVTESLKRGKKVENVNMEQLD